MAKQSLTAEPVLPRVLDTDDIVNVLEFVSASHTLEIGSPEARDQVECGRMLVIDWITDCIRHNRVLETEVAHG